MVFDMLNPHLVNFPVPIFPFESRHNMGDASLKKCIQFKLPSFFLYQVPWMQIQFYLYQYGKYFHFYSCFTSRSNCAQIGFWLLVDLCNSSDSSQNAQIELQSPKYFLLQSTHSSSLVLVFKSHPICTVILHVASVLLVSARKYQKSYKYLGDSRGVKIISHMKTISRMKTISHMKTISPATLSHLDPLLRLLLLFPDSKVVLLPKLQLEHLLHFLLLKLIKLTLADTQVFPDNKLFTSVTFFKGKNLMT